jgi:sialidase-1
MSRQYSCGWLLCGILVGGLGGAPFGGRSSGEEVNPSGIAAHSSSPVHPLLIRNEHGPLLRVVVEVTGSQPVRARSFSFRMTGTDDVGDVEFLALYATGEREDFSPAVRFGEPAQPLAIVAFRADAALRPGKNVFWLSCRLNDRASLGHKVAAVCTAVETTVGMVTPREVGPARPHRIGFALRKARDDGVHTYRIPALATTRSGTLLCVYDMRRRMGRDLQEDIDIGLSRSTDGGQSWQPPDVIMDMGEYGGLPPEQNGCSDPGIIVDHVSGEIFCFAVWMNGKPGKHQWNGDGSEPGFEIGKSAQFLMVRSRDDGVTWTKPENMTRRLKQESWWLFAPSPQQGIQLPDGTLVMPSQGRDENGAKFSTIMTSSDHGANWSVGSPAHTGGSECQAVRLGDGALMLNMRNDRENFRAVYTTRDLGRSWEPHATNRNTLIEPTCNGSLLRFDYEDAGAPKHVLIFANPHNQKGRTHQTIQVSFDDGQTWPPSHHLLLDEGRGAGYPSLTRVDDRHLGIVYEGSQSHLVFERLALAELLQR